MKFEMKPLPYDYGALEPHISARTLEFHYDKHHAGYLKKLRAGIEDTPLADKSLEAIILATDGAVFNSAAQVWNHDFYWQSLSPDGGGSPEGDLKARIEQRFGSVQQLRDQLKSVATGQFGSGWAWLVANDMGELDVMNTPDAENPLQQGLTPLLTIDVWEHAYYLDVQNERGTYVDRVLNELLNWDFAAANLAALTEGNTARKAG